MWRFLSAIILLLGAVCLTFILNKELLTVSVVNMFITLLLLFLFSSLFLLVIRIIAKYIGLVDKPNFRKHHQGAIPLVGGMTVYAGICFYFLISNNPIDKLSIYLTCAGLLVFVGVLDDRFDLSVKLRAAIQALVACAMMFVAGLYLKSLGGMFGPWNFSLSWFGYIITLFAVVAAINAFNMIDGIDGLLGGVSAVTFGALAIVLYIDGQPLLAAWCLAIIVVILPYILLNLGLLGQQYKVFMGDAGSTLIGFTVIWILLQSTQGPAYPLYPVTALWFIAIPLMDMVAVMYRRLRKGKSIFSPDRLHIHHIMIRSGFTPRQAFALITCAAIIFAAIGIAGEYLSFITEWMMLILFLLMFILYSFCLKNAWRLARYLRRSERERKKQSI